MKQKYGKPFLLVNRIKSFAFAFRGLRILLKEEHNARIHLIATFLVIILALFFDISGLEWISILLSIGLVFCFESINTVIENMSDLISQEKNDAIRSIKDISAAAVFIAALIALIIGTIVFLPKVIALC